MTATQLYWIAGPWLGRLAIAARPRGGDWLEDEVLAWRRAGVETVFSLLTPPEELDLELVDEASAAESQGLRFLRFPILDRDVPDFEEPFVRVLDQIDKELDGGRNVAVHCRQGVGRSGMVAACLLVGRGMDPSVAAEQVSRVRGVSVPETHAQLRWIERLAARMAAAHS